MEMCTKGLLKKRTTSLDFINIMYYSTDYFLTFSFVPVLHQKTRYAPFARVLSINQLKSGDKE